MSAVTRGARPFSRRLRGAAAALLALALPLTGCGYEGASSLPLPGGPDLGDDPYEVRVQFANVLDLVPYSQVKVNDVTVGKVTEVELEDWHAVVTVQLRKDVRLPDNAVATISQTSLLGEKFVALSKPPGESATPDRLGDHDVIPLSRTSRTTEVEELLSALSLLVNGGGLEQIQTITREANAAMTGRTDKIKSVLRQVNTFIGTMDRQKSQIVRTIERVDRLTSKLRANKKVITDTIDKTGPALKVLESQRADLTKLLVSLDKLGKTATRVIDRSRDDLVRNLKAVEPILRNVNKVGKGLPEGLEMMLAFPFPPTTPNAIRGDYTNLFLTLDLDFENISHNLFSGTPLEGLAKTGAKLRGLLSPPRTGFPDTPLGALPDPGYGGAGAARPTAPGQLPVVPGGPGDRPGQRPDSGESGGEKGKKGSTDESRPGAPGGPAPWPGGVLPPLSGGTDNSGLNALLVGGL